MQRLDANRLIYARIMQRLITNRLIFARIMQGLAINRLIYITKIERKILLDSLCRTYVFLKKCWQK